MTFFTPGRTLVFAHRGADLVAPENTIPAFKEAEHLGADGVELDVRLSRNGDLIVMHDSSVQRTTGQNGRVSQLTLKQLKALDAGCRFDPAFRGTRIPTLEEVFAALRPQTLVNIEIKANPLWHSPTIEEKLVRFLQAERLTPQVLIASFAPLALRRIRRLAPEIATAQLCTKYVFLPCCLQQAWRSGAQAVHPHRTTTSRQLVEDIHRAGFHVGVWTVNDEEEMRRLVQWGVEIIITDWPERLQAILANAY